MAEIPKLRTIVTKNGSKNNINQKVIELIAEVMSVSIEEITIETDLSATLGADSMDIVTIAAGLSEEFEIDIDLAEIPENGVTVAWISSEVNSMLETNP